MVRDGAKKLWLTRQHDGSYMLTAARPVIADVKGAGHRDAYVRTGEPIGLRHMCAAGTRAIFGVELAPLESIEICIAAGPAGAEGQD